MILLNSLQTYWINLICISDINPNYLNRNNNIEFTLGLAYDGYENYTDLKENPDPKIQALSRLYVYDDPRIQTFAASFGNEVFVSIHK